MVGNENKIVNKEETFEKREDEGDWTALPVEQTTTKKRPFSIW